MIQVLQRFHAIMEIMAENPDRPRLLGELAAALRVSSPACANIVRTMVELGYLHHIGLRQGYLPGPALHRFVGANPYGFLSNTATPHIESLAGRWGVVILLVAESGGKRMELRRMDGMSQILIRPHQGNSVYFDLFRCATGLLLLGGMEESRARFLWNAHPAAADNILGIPEYAEFRRRTAELLHRGEIVIDTPGDDIVTMAVPLYLHGRLTAALGAMTTRSNLPAEQYPALLGQMRRAVEGIAGAGVVSAVGTSA